MKTNQGYTCLFGGGAIRGAAHAGVVRALNDLGITPDVFGGSSVGSIVAALCAVGYSYEELAQVFLSVNFELFRDISLGFNTKFALSKGEVFLEWLRELIEKKFYKDRYKKGCNEHITFKDLDKNLIIITTNMKDFSCCEFSNYETPDFEIAMAVRISCCMPGLMRAVNFENKLLVDGDLMKGKPMWSLSKNIKNSNNRILEIRLEGEFSGDDTKPLTYVNGMYSCMTYSETAFIESIYRYSDNYDYLVINTGDVVVVDFNYPHEKRQAIIDSGYLQATNYFKSFMPQKKQKLIYFYSEINNSLKQIKQSIKRKKYIQAKHVLAELFIILADTNYVIDISLLKEIKIFQKLFYSNVGTGLLGYSYCNNLELIKSALNSLLSSTEIKLEELNNYLRNLSFDN